MEYFMSQAGQDTQLAVYYHTHWDREWYLPFRAYQVRLAEVVDEVLDQLERKVLSCFMLDGQTVVLDDYLELRPENRERLKRFIENGQLSIGPWYVMPDEFLVGGESLIRNLMRGIRESRTWGCQRFTGYLPDTFGHSADMPTILKNFGLTSTVLWRGVHPQKSLLRWQSPSGASVLALHLTDGYFQMMLHDWTATESQKLEALDTLIDKLKSVSPASGLELLPIGGDHLAPLSEDGHALLRKRYPNLLETTPDRFLSKINVNGSVETAGVSCCRACILRVFI
jgi:mannosylglycerate hydrolase